MAERGGSRMSSSDTDEAVSTKFGCEMLHGTATTDWMVTQLTDREGRRLLFAVIPESDILRHRGVLLRDIATSAQHLLDTDDGRIPPHCQLWLRDLVADFGHVASPSAVQPPNEPPASDTLGAKEGTP